MKGLKKLALASAVLAVSTGAFAMEAMQDDDLSSTVAQNGISITSTGTNLAADAIRYYDVDGSAGLVAQYGLTPSTTSTPNPLDVYLTQNGTSATSAFNTIVDTAACGASLTTNVGCLAGYSTAGGSVSLNRFFLTQGSATTTIDVGDNGTTTALLIGSTASNLNVYISGISLDNGDEISGAGAALGATGAVAVTHGGVTYNPLTGIKTSGSDLGGLAITGINLSPSLNAITAGATDLGSTSGITITGLVPTELLSMTVKYFNTNDQGVAVAGVGSYTVSGTGSNGLISLPVNLIGFLQGATEIAVGNAPANNFAPTAGEALEIYQTGMLISYVDIGGDGLVGSPAAVATGGVQIAGTTIGSIGIENLRVGSSTMYISGH